MNSDELRLRLDHAGFVEAHRLGGHLVVQDGSFQTTVPLHVGRDLPTGSLAAISRDLRLYRYPEVFNALFA